jgi:hypothetical protein
MIRFVGSNKTLLSKIALPLAVVLAPSVSLAANHYVRSGASGNGSGSDWTNAYSSLPSSLVRGDTYYVAAGSYPGKTFSDPVSGTTPIAIKKATASDHGTDTGWQSSYGTGQAVFGNFSITTSNYVIDGQYRNESNWFDSASYGFSIGTNTSQQQITIKNYGNAPDNVTIKYAYVPAWSAALPSTTQRIYAIDVDDGDGQSTSTGLVFSHMYVSGGNNIWFMRTTNGAIVEYNANSGVKSNSANHGEIVNLYYSGNNAIVRYNIWKDAYLGSGGTALVAITQANGLQFYGNVAYNFNVGDGAIGFDGYSSSHNRVYNNTFIGSIGYNAGVRWGSGTDNLTYNNLYINCATVTLEGTHDYNGFSDSSARGEAHAQVSIPTSIFVNYSGQNFRLVAPTSPGMSMASPFNMDMLGATRGADGVVDRGAYEYSTSGTPVLAAPTNLRVTN